MKRTIALLLALGACTAQPATPTNPAALDTIANFTIADLDSATQIAQANNDAIGAACWPALKKFVQDLQPANNAATVKGAFSAFEKARVTRIGIQGGLPDYLKLGCGALVVDEVTLLNRLAALGLGAAAGGPLGVGAGAAAVGAAGAVLAPLKP